MNCGSGGGSVCIEGRKGSLVSIRCIQGKRRRKKWIVDNDTALTTARALWRTEIPAANAMTEIALVSAVSRIGGTKRF